MKTSQFLFLGTSILVGCTTYDPAPCGCVSPTPHYTDAAVSRDLASVSDSAIPADLSPLDGLLARDDIAAADVLAPMSDVADAIPVQTVDASVVDKPAFNPTPGHYTARLDPDLSNPGDSISRLDAYGFTVSLDANGQFVMDMTYDNWAHYGFAVTNGGFDYKHGQGWDGYGGTSCPTDGFGIVGSFVSPTEARGLYKGLAWRCQATSSGYFIATLDPQAVTPLDAQAPDVTSQ